MFQAYKDLKNNSSNTRWKCVKFQIWTWWYDLKQLPYMKVKNKYIKYKLRKLAKKDPTAYKRVLHELSEIIWKK